jgi:hypothetical protein
MTLAFNATATEPTWSNLDPDTLPPAIRKQYDACKAAYALASDARKAFEATFRAAVVVPAGHEAVLGYRFGKLSYAFLPAKASKSKANLVAFASLTRK